jgi:hypothetical protein
VARGELERVVGAVVEGPGAAHGEAHVGGVAEHAGDAVPGAHLHGLVHEPVRVPPVHVEGPAVQEQPRAAPLDEGRRGRGVGRAEGEGERVDVQLAEGEVHQRHATGHAEDVVQAQAAAERHCCVGGVVGRVAS